MVFITINITGLNEVIARNQRMMSEAQNIKRTALDMGAEFLANQMRANAHVITGRMKGSISRGTASGDSVDVVVTAPYSQFENKRPGSKAGSPHNFADRALQSTMSAFPSMIMSAYSRWTSL